MHRSLFPFCCFLILLCGSRSLRAQQITTQGTAFYFSMTSNQNSNSAKLFITSTKNTSGRIYNPHSSYSDTFIVQANGTAIINLNRAESVNTCNETIQNKALKIEANDTISAFVLHQGGASTDASLILPVQALGVEYRIISYPKYSGNGSQAMVVAIQDSTEVQIIPSVNTVGGKSANNSYTIWLDKGESYGLKGSDLTGTYFKSLNSCKPIAVYSGNECSNVPSGCGYCDHLYEQIFPIETWGQNFIFTSSRSRNFDLIRILTHDTNTVVVNGSSHSMLPGTYITENCSTFNSLKITGAKPIAVMGFTTGQACGGGRGDPAMFWITPIEQYLNEIVFCATPFSGIDSNYVNILVKTEDTARLYLNDSLVTLFDTTVDPGYMVAKLFVHTGSNKINCLGGFSAYSYGFGNANSYAYSTGSSARGLQMELLINGKSVSNKDTGYVCFKSEAQFGIDFNYSVQGILWNFGDGDTSTSETPVHKYKDTGTYNLQLFVFRGGDCNSVTDTFSCIIRMRDSLVMTLSADTLLCAGATHTLTPLATGGDTSGYVFSWNNGLGIGPSKTISSDTGIVYRVILDDGCTEYTDTAFANISVRPLLQINVQSDSTICSGDTIRLHASGTGGLPGEYSFIWDHGLDTGNYIPVSPDTTTEYRVILTDYCTAVNDTAEVTVFVREELKVLTRDDTTVCRGEYIDLYAFGDGGDTSEYYLTWDHGLGMGDSFVLNPQHTTTYQVIVGNNCINESDTGFVTITVRDSLNIIPRSDTTICIGEQLFLYADAYGGNDTDYHYLWDNGLDTGRMQTVSPEITTVYTVVLSDNCTVEKDSAEVTINVRLPLNTGLRSDTTICVGEEVILYTIPSGGNSSTWQIDWDNGLGTGVNKTVSPVITTTYRAILSDNCTSKPDTAEITVFVRTPLQVTMQNDTTLCRGQSFQLSVSASGDTSLLGYSWDNGLGIGSAHVVTPQHTTSYTAIAENICVNDKDTGMVTVFVRDSLKVVPRSDTTICIGEQLLLYADIYGGYSNTYRYDWNQGLDTGKSQIIAPDTTTTYKVVASDNCTLLPDSAEVTITVRPSLNVGLRSDTTICVGEEVILYTTPTGGNPAARILSWNNGLGTGPNKPVSPAVTTTYQVILSDNCTVKNDTAEVTVYVRPPLVVTAMADTFICNGQSSRLFATATGGDSLNYVYTWNQGVGQANYTIQQPTVSTTYSVTLTDNCTVQAATDSAVIHVRVPLSLYVPADTLICKGQFRDMYVFGTGGDSSYYDYIWDQGLGTGNNKVVQPDATTTYRVIFTDNCTAISDTGFSTVNIRPELTLTPRTDTTICVGEQVNLYASHAGGYSPQHLFTWDHGLDTGFSKTVSPDTTTTYRLILSDNCTVKEDTAEITVTVRPPLEVTGRTDTVICRGESLNLFANAAGGNVATHDFSWDQGVGTGAAHTIQPDYTTTYIVILKDNCTFKDDTAQVTVTVRDSLHITPRSDTTICIGEGVQLFAQAAGGYTPNYVYSWDNGLGTGQYQSVSPDTTTSYQVIINDNCTVKDDTAEVLITVRPKLETGIRLDTTICIGESVVIFTNPLGGNAPGHNVDWDMGLGNGFSKIVSPDTTTKYRAILTDNCTTDPDTGEVTVFVRPALEVTVRSDTTICRGQEVILHASGIGGHVPDHEFIWDKGIGSANYETVNPQITTTYEVRLADNCTFLEDTAYVTVTVRDPLVITGRSDTTICQGENVILSATALGGYQAGHIFSWNEGLGDTNYIAVNPRVTTVYKVVLRDNCTVQNDSTEITVNVRPGLEANMPADTIICRGESFDFNISGTGGYVPNYFFSWDNGLGTGTSKTVSPDYTTTYSVILTDLCSDSTDTSFTTVIVRDSLHVQVSQDTLICEGESTELRASGFGGNVPGHIFSWDKGLGQGANQWVSPSTSETYMVILTDNCTTDPDTAWINVNVRPPLSVLATGYDEICLYDTAILDANGLGGYFPGYQYTWDNGGGAGKQVLVNPSVTTLYTVTLDDGCSTPATDTMTIDVEALPIPDFVSDSIQCYPEPVQFTNMSVFLPGSMFFWDFGDGNDDTALHPLNYYPAAGTYTVQLNIVSPRLCTDSVIKNGMVTIHPKPAALYDAQPDTALITSPVIRFVNQSTVANNYYWEMGDGTLTSAQNPTHEYADTGSYWVTLYASNEFGCADTFSKKVKIKDVFLFHIPNAFTPDQDEKNEKFAPEGQGIVSYKLEIYNRWGQQIFQGTGDRPSWDGTMDGGKPATSGVYVYVIRALDFEGNVHRYKGTVALIR